MNRDCSCDDDGVNSKAYDPFRRLDRYGDRGLVPQRWTEQFRLALFAVVVLPARIIISMTCMLLCYALCWGSRLLLPEPLRYTVVATVGKVLCRVCLFAFGFFRIEWVQIKSFSPKESVEDNDGEGAKEVRPCGIVSNHVGWADILIHMERWFPSFVAKSKTKELPFVGIISQMMGCIYVDRSNKSGGGVSGQVRDRMKESIASGNEHQLMLLFPEGTTTNGRYLLPFKTGAFLAGGPIQPVVIKYSYSWASPAWESISGKRHLFLLLCAPWHFATCYQLPVYVPSEEEQRDPAKFAANVRSYMSESCGLLASESTFDDKLHYHFLLSGKTEHL